MDRNSMLSADSYHPLIKTGIVIWINFIGYAELLIQRTVLKNM